MLQKRLLLFFISRMLILAFLSHYYTPLSLSITVYIILSAISLCPWITPLDFPRRPSDVALEPPSPLFPAGMPSHPFRSTATPWPHVHDILVLPGNVLCLHSVNQLSKATLQASPQKEDFLPRFWLKWSCDEEYWVISDQIFDIPKLN